MASSPLDSSSTTSATIPASSQTAVTNVISSNHSFSIKLNSKNYLIWKTQLLPIIHCHKLMSHIDGSIKAPPQFVPSKDDPNQLVPNPEFDPWFQKDQLLLSWLFASISEEIFPYLVGLESSFSVWSALSQAFGSISQNRQLQLHIELQELKRQDMSVSQYLQRAKALADELASAGRRLSEAEFNAIIYRNIGSEYHPIITALNLRPTPVSFHELHGHLIAHEILLKSTQDVPLANVAVMNNKTINPSSTTGVHNQHTSRNQSFNSSQRRNNRGPCQICGLKNHTADRCRKRYHRNFGAQANVAWHGNPSHSQSDCQNQYFHGSQSNSYQPGALSWIPDTGATHHMTPDVSQIQNPAPYHNGDVIRVGNGQGDEGNPTQRPE